LDAHGGNFRNQTSGDLIDRTAGRQIAKPSPSPAAARLNGMLRAMDGAMKNIDEFMNATSLNPFDAGDAQ
jgi:hypothetical protein